MTRINLDSIRIEFPLKPTKIWNKDPKYIFEDYRVFGYFLNQKIGHITVSLAVKYPLKERNDFWFDRKKEIVARPVAVFQDTIVNYRGEGVSARLLMLTNKIVKEKFNQPLASDTTFCQTTEFEWEEKGYHLRPAMRVWQKLEAENLAYSKPYHQLPRWIMY